MLHITQKKTFIAWIVSGVAFAVAKLFIDRYNVYKVYEWVFRHAREGISLYTAYPSQHEDYNYYGIFFSAVIAPFAMMPEWLGVILWVVANTAFLFYAIKQLPIEDNAKMFIYWFSLYELMEAQKMQQFNISVAAIIILAFALIERRKEFWAAAVIMAGTFIKIYPIVGLAFFFFSKRKWTFVASCAAWAVVCFALPMLYTPSPEYVVSQYVEWFQSLADKSGLNNFSIYQNISLIGIVRKYSGIATYSDLWVMIPGLILFFIPYARIGQYKNFGFRIMLLASVLMFVVLFSTGTETSGYILAIIAIAIWYLFSPTPHKKYKLYLTFFSLVVVGLCSTEIVPRQFHFNVIMPYVLKAWPCVIVWFSICYDMIFLDFDQKKTCTISMNDTCLLK